MRSRTSVIHLRPGSRAVALTSAAALSLAMLGPSAAAGADGNLPGGTAISVTIDEPGEDLTIEVAQDGDVVDVALDGTAQVGGAAVSKNTTVVYILDTSGSMTSGSGVDCTGNGSSDNRLVCQAEAVAFVNDLAKDPVSPVGFTGVGTYGTSGAVYDVDLAPDGNRLLVPPDYDGNGNGVPDIEDVVRARRTAGFTNFTAGLDQALLLLAESTTAVNRVVYISDGVANRGTRVLDYAGDFDGFGTTRIDTFAITSGSACATGTGGTYGSLDEIASLTPGGSCTEVTDLTDLNVVLGQVLSSELSGLSGTVGGGEPQEITTVSAALPQAGPVSIDYTWEVGTLGVGTHELCVTATGSDGGGGGSITDCRTVTIGVPSDDDTDEDDDTQVLDESLESDGEGDDDGSDDAGSDGGDRDPVEVLGEATPAKAVTRQPTYAG